MYAALLIRTSTVPPVIFETLSAASYGLYQTKHALTQEKITDLQGFPFRDVGFENVNVGFLQLFGLFNCLLISDNCKDSIFRILAER